MEVKLCQCRLFLTLLGKKEAHLVIECLLQKGMASLAGFTAWGIIGLLQSQALGPLEYEAISTGVTWLLDNQLPDGSWYPEIWEGPLGGEDISVTYGFVKRVHRDALLVSDEPEDMLKKIKSYQAPIVEKWIGLKAKK